MLASLPLVSMEEEEIVPGKGLLIRIATPQLWVPPGEKTAWPAQSVLKA